MLTHPATSASPAPGGDLADEPRIVPAPPRTVAAPAHRPARVDDVHRLRAVAIVQIVLLHAFAVGLNRVQDASLLPFPSALPYTALRSGGRLVELLFHDATIYFVLISGIVFAHVYATRSAACFFRSRFTHVVVPYVAVTAVVTAAYWRPGRTSAAALPGIALRNVLTGKADYQLWYMVVAVGLFALGPILYRIAAAPRLAPLAVAIAAAPLVVSRTSTEVTPQQVVYFGGAYLLGMAMGRDLVRVRAFAAAHLRPLTLVAALATLGVALAGWARIPRLGVTSIQESLFYVQKVALFPILLHLSGAPLARLGSTTTARVDRIAEYSLGIYLLHQTPLTLLKRSVVSRVLGPELSLSAWAAVGVASAVIALAASVAAIGAVRRLLPGYSRFLVGA